MRHPCTRTHKVLGKLALDFARSAFRHACVTCEWDSALLASAEGTPPPVS